MSELKRRLFIVLGFLSLAIGFIGAFLPILPTVPFALLAAFFFSRSSQRLHLWLLSRPHFGPAIMDWETNRVIRPRAKALAVSFLILGMAYPIGFGPIPLWAKAIMALIALSVIVFILSRPSTPRL